MSEAGPETRWFDVGAVRRSKASQLRVIRIVMGIICGIAVVGGLAAILITEGAEIASVVAVGGVVLFVGAVVAMGIWWSRRGAAGSGSDIEWLGVARAGIWFTTSQGTSHVPWEGLGGVRIHSVLSGYASGALTQSMSLDLLGPGQPVIGKQSRGMDAGLRRVHLADAVGVFAANAYALVTDVGHAIRGYCPGMWRGFTKDSGFGYIEFQSWVSPEQTIHQLSAELGNPTWDNFGGGRHPGPPR